MVCLFPCTYVFLIFPTVWLLYMLFISMYIRIPHIANRMAFIYGFFISMYIRIPHTPNRMTFTYAVHVHVHTYSSYSWPYVFYIRCSFPRTYVFLVFTTVLVFADGGSSLRRCVTAEICGIAMQAEDTADSILLQTRGARMAFMCQRTKV
jgi:hypothetical protein